MNRQTDGVSSYGLQNHGKGSINRLISRVGGNIALYDKDNQFVLGNIRKDNKSINTEEKLKYIRENASNNLEEGYFFVVGEGRYQNKEMVYGRIIDNDNLLVIEKGMGIVSEASSVFLNFLKITAVLIYIIAFFIIWLIADRFARPIVTLKDAAERIASFDFSESIKEEGSDEVSELIISVNTMASELAQNIRALNNSNEKLAKELSKEKSLERMRRRFVSDVSHELKNPISMIIAYAEGLQRGLPKTKNDQDHYIQVILEEGKRMNLLTKNLLDLSSYESGTFTLKREEVDIKILANDAIDRFSYIADKKSIELDYNINQPCIISGDRLRLGQVITNLMSNAFKHAGENGKIIVDIKSLSDKVKITISNTGSLIPESELENIWKSFYQVETDSEGNGLGLTIVKSIVNLHNGKVRAYVENDMNSFEVILPK